MGKKLVLLLTVAVLLVGCGNAKTPDSEVNTHQTENKSEAESLETSTEQDTTNVETETTTEITSEVENEMQTENEVSREPQAPTYTYTDLDKTMYAKSSVNVRDLPSTDGNKLGGLSKAQEVHVTGQCNETGWYRIEYKCRFCISNNWVS